MKTTTYKGCTIRETEYTTDVTRRAFGRSYQTIGYLYAVSGRIEKSAGRQPFLTSIAACREYVDGQDMLREGR